MGMKLKDTSVNFEQKLYIPALCIITIYLLISSVEKAIDIIYMVSLCKDHAPLVTLYSFCLDSVSFNIFIYMPTY